MTRRSVSRIGTSTGSALLVLGGLALTLAWFSFRSSVQRDEGRIRVRGLDGEVSVRFDSAAIPHISATTEHDLFFGQGWVFASQRLWQLELFRRTAEGRLAELFGEAALDADRFLRTLDLWGLAERSLQAATPDERRILEAYAAGVNAKIARWIGAWPPEFRLLGIEPEPWTPAATLAVGRLMALDLATWKSELGRFRAEALVSDEKFRELVPPYPVWGPTIAADSLGVPASLALTARGGRLATPGPLAARFDPGANAPSTAPSPANRDPRWDPLSLIGRYSARSGSNAWAIAGSRTAAGSPILASDMHLQLRAPSIWYVVALEARSAGYQAAGLTLPGVPGVVAGYNREVAWTYTNGMVDDMDFVSEAVNLDHSAYRHEDAWMPFATRPETILVRGRDDPVIHDVRSTVRGPVITDALAPVGATLSLLWTAAQPLSEIGGLMAMNRAVDAESIDAAIRDFSVHQQNVIYATRDGSIGFRLSGTVPLRRADRRFTPADFTEEGAEWPGFWSAAQLPATRDPEAGFIVSANNLQTRELEGVLSVDYPTPFRALRATRRLASRTDWDRESVSLLQRDVYSLMAERALPTALATARRAGLDSAIALLDAWDLEVDTGSRAAALFYAWLFRLRGLIAADEFGLTPAWSVFPTGALLHLIENGGDSPWVDDMTTPDLETFDELSERALHDAVTLTGNRTWGDLHREVHRHPLGYVRWLNRVFSFNVGSYPSPGGPNTVRPDDYGRWNLLDASSWTPPWPNEYGPSERFIVELRQAGNAGFFLLPTGQSGNPLSPHYRDQSERWGNSRLIPVPLEAELVRERTVRRLILEPARPRD